MHLTSDLMISKRHICGWLTASVMMFLCSMVIGQNSFSFDHITVDQGLSNNSVYSISQDKRGYMWFGTRNGLDRYDGQEFKSYEILKDGLQGNNVQSLLCHDNGELWIGLRTGGLAIFDPVSESISQYDLGSETLNRAFIREIYLDREGRIWLATEMGGIVLIDKDGIHQFHSESDDDETRLSSNDCFSIIEDETGRIWIGCTGQDLSYFDEDRGSFISPTVDNDRVFGSLKALRKELLYFDNRIWVGTFGGGLYNYDLGSRRVQTVDFGSFLISDIQAGPDGEVMISTDGEGFFISYDTCKSFEQNKYDDLSESTLNTNALYDIYIDKDDNIWIGSFNGGVNVHKRNKAKFFSFKFTSPDENTIGFSNSPLCFEEDKEGNIWVGLDGGGLVKMNKELQTVERFQRGLSSDNGICSDVITELLIDDEGIIWMGSFENGLISYDPDKKAFECQRFDEDSNNSIRSNNVWALESDDEGNLWIGTLGGGLSHYNKASGLFTHFAPIANDDQSLSDLNILDLLMSEDGTLWIGTEFGGLNRLDKAASKFKRYRFVSDSAGGLRSDVIRCLFQDRDGLLWIGTEGGGLHSLDPTTEEIMNYSAEDGLPSNVILGVLEGQDKKLWISTINGLSALDREAGIFYNYTKGDGLQSDQFNAGAQLLDSKGRIFFGGISGITTFYPGDIKINTTPPEIVLTEFIIYGDEGPRYQKLNGGHNDNIKVTLNYWEKTFSIGFAALEYTNPDNHSYQYRLNGFDDEWRSTKSNDRRATYTNLDQGTYEFVIRAANNDGVWSAEPRHITIVVKPPFWETWWFILFMSIIGLVIIVAIIMDREERRKQAHDKQLLLAQQEILALKNERLEETVERKSSELSAALLQSAHKNNSLESLKKELADLRASEVATQGSKEIRALIRKIDSELSSEDYWKLFQLNFDEVHQQFSLKLQELHPNLTVNDLKLSSLIKIGMTNSEIATVQGISVGAVEKSKYRLKKKLGLEEKDRLNQYLITFGG